MVRTCRKTGVQVDLFDGEPPAPRPAWRIIEAARTRRLTGELSLPSNPPTNIYLIDGEVYFAERTTDGGIGVRLLVEGVITRKQMSKGSVMVSGAEHLGRLFERDETIDRHAVELCVELMTDDVLTSVSKETVDSYTMTLYKRHPSGIDRWLANESTTDAPAVSEDQRDAVLADVAPTTAVAAPVNGATMPSIATPVVATPIVAAPVVPEPILVAPAPAPPIPQTAMPRLVVPEPVLAQPILPTATPTISVPQPEPAAEAATAVARAPEPVVRTPERIEFDGWPELDNRVGPAVAPPVVTRAADTYPKLPDQTAASAPAAGADDDAKLPGAIADEVADAVRRALAAIDSVLTPANDSAKPPQS